MHYRSTFGPKFVPNATKIESAILQLLSCIVSYSTLVNSRCARLPSRCWPPGISIFFFFLPWIKKSIVFLNCLWSSLKLIKRFKNYFLPQFEVFLLYFATKTKIALEAWIVFNIYLNSIYEILLGFPCIWNIFAIKNYILNTVFKSYFQKESTGEWLKFFQIPYLNCISERRT